jgi:predicted TIM-barrel fold metal-dependent hydrolase
MTTELAAHIQQMPLCDTHEHLHKEHTWIDEGPDILQDLFGNYVVADLKTAGANPAAIERLLHKPDAPVGDRFRDIQSAWHATQFTGYGEAVRLIASKIYGLEELTAGGLDQAQTRLTDLRKAGGRYDLLKNEANLDHIQTDDGCWPCLPDRSGLDFFFYDLSWVGFCNGQIDPEAIEAETSVAVNDLNSLDKAMAAIFAKYASVAIAVKTQHAYSRTLFWEEREQEDASRALEAVLSKGPEDVPEATRLCLGDWCWAKGVELAVEHDLPFKIHTGYYAGNDRMPVDRIAAGNMCGLLAKYLDARFVLMHIAYPYNNELIAIAKHYPNVWVDLCWAWSIDPFSSADFVRRFIHTVPVNKLFGFGGDTGWPTSSAAYAIQMRHWFTSAMESEVVEGLLTEPQAKRVASRIMHDNQYDCFDVEGTRRNIAAASA